MLRLVLVLSVIMTIGNFAQAKNLYVNNSGSPACSNTTTYAANSATAPWCTIMRAARGATTYDTAVATQAAQPGDVILVSAGVYWENGHPTGGRFTVALNPVNNGTSASPITFRGTGLVYVRMNANFRGGLIGCASSNYIIWDHFQIDDFYGGSTSDTGPVVFSNSNYCQVINSDIKGHPGSYYHGYATFGGNYRGVSIEPSNFTTVKNNRIYNFRGGQNECAVMTYDSNDNTIENNTMYDNGCGVFIKGQHPGSTQSRNVIRKNHLYNNNIGIRILGSQDALVYQNIVVNGNTADSTGLWAGFGTSERSRFVNNTVYNVGKGLVPQTTTIIDVRFLNNIISNSTVAAIYDWSVTNPSEYDVNWDRNLYFNNPRLWTSEVGPALNFAQFQAAGEEANGLEANPLFVDAAAGNFKLQTSSPARTLGRDFLNLTGQGVNAVIPAGAYITGNEIIGATGTTSPPAATLSRPANVRILRVRTN